MCPWTVLASEFWKERVHKELQALAMLNKRLGYDCFAENQPALTSARSSGRRAVSVPPPRRAVSSSAASEAPRQSQRPQFQCALPQSARLRVELSGESRETGQLLRIFW